ASLRVTEGFSIPNLTVRGTAQIAADSQPLTIDGRLVFGRNGAVFFLGDTNRLLLSNGAIVLRRGAGSLSHAPTTLGSFDVFYDLDDGSHSNVDSGFGPGVMSSGFELNTNSSSGIRNLGVMAGARNGGQNTLHIVSDVHISGAFTLFSGVVDLGTSLLSFDSGASFSINEIDSDAPTQLLAATGYTSSGPLDVSFLIKYRNFTTDELVLPSALSVRAFRVELGEDGAPFSPDFFMHRDLSAEEFELTAASSLSALNLLGYSLDVQGDIRIDGGTLTSNEIADVHSAGHFLLRTGSRIEEAISVSVEGDATIDGFFNGRGIDITGNLSVPGAFGSGVRLRFVGQNQEFRSVGDVSIWELILEQEAGSVNDPSKVTLEAVGAAFDLIVGSNLVLTSGVLSTGANRLMLPGSVTGFSRDPSPGNPSHVAGSISRIALFGTESFVFPLGDERIYRPLTVVFVDPLLSSTQLTARHAGAPPFGTNGLPLEEAGGPTIRSTAPYVWSISSSTDLLPIQFVDVRVQFDPNGFGATEDLRIIARPHSLLAEPWAFLSSSNSAMDVSGQLELTATRADLDLNTRGIDFTVGLPVAAAADAALQFVHSYPHNPVDEVRLEIDGYAFGEAFTFNTASQAVPVALQSTETEHHQVTVREGATGEVMVETAVTLAPDGRTVVAFVSTPAGDKTILSTIVPSFGSVPMTDLGLGFINASADFPIMHVELNESGSPLFAGAAVGSIFPPVIALPEYTVIQFIQQVGVDITDRFEFDFSPLAGRTPILLLSGYLNPPQSAGPEKYLKLSVLLSDGSILASTLITKSETPEEPTLIPRQFVIHGNYPNPFNPTTTLLYDLPYLADIRLTVVDMLGRVVFTIEYANMQPGKGKTIAFDASRLASGTYLYRIDARTRGSLFTGTGKMIVLK
ncbi:MAG: T9SS type A sorting domain-containing protein, partial [Bacteroidetes bacterium]|nr:T9SS type A sorting domain-containing protein [Bacteroidota bacterium]